MPIIWSACISARCRLPIGLIRHHRNELAPLGTARARRTNDRTLPLLFPSEVTEKYGPLDSGAPPCWLPDKFPHIGGDALRTFDNREAAGSPVSRAHVWPNGLPLSDCSPCWTRDRHLANGFAGLTSAAEGNDDRRPVGYTALCATDQRIPPSPSPDLNSDLQVTVFGALGASHFRLFKRPRSRRLRRRETERIRGMKVSGGAAAAVAACMEEIGEQDGSCVHDRLCAARRRTFSQLRIGE